MINESDVKRIVQLTINELKKQELLRDAESAAYKEISERLTAYYWGSVPDTILVGILGDLRTDKYYEIIPAFYRDKNTVEQIAEMLDVDVRTVSRNKKRLCLEIYMRLR